ncbi:MAG: class I adenylate-forming enzyme family protein [Dehalococcoidia bacterium]|nr:class I adenylate-forming enzyme family protein [Dehalococcoidia bacterium]
MAKATRYTPALIKEYREKGFWDDTRLCDVWDRNAREFPTREALCDSSRRLTYGEANLWIDRLALGLVELGMEKDELLVVQLPNVVELPLLRVACEKSGVLCLPVLRSLRHTEMEYILNTTGASGIVIPPRAKDFDYYGMVEEIRPRLPGLKRVFMTGDETPPGVISIQKMVKNPLEKKYPPDFLEPRKCPSTGFSLVAHTTGTTGFPKFVEYPVCGRNSLSKRNIARFGITGNDVFGILGPAALGPINMGYFISPVAGAKTALLERFEPGEALQLLQREKVTVACVVPTILAMIVRYPKWEEFDCSSVRYWWSAGSALNYKTAEEVEEKLGGKIINVLGAVDFGGECVTPPEAPRQVRLTTAGRPVDGTEIKLVDDGGREAPGGEVGRIWGRGPSCVSGYFKDLEATRKAWTEDGWYNLGDLGRWDKEGNLVVVGREKDMIIRGGQNIYPAEIENLASSHPRVMETALVGYPDPVMGEKACLFIVPKKGENIGLEEIVSYLRSRNIASFKLPEKAVILDKLPLAGEQKIDKKALRQLLIETEP